MTGVPVLAGSILACHMCKFACQLGTVSAAVDCGEAVFVSDTLRLDACERVLPRLQGLLG